MNYGYSQQVGGGPDRYGMGQPYQAPSMSMSQGPSAFQRYAQGLDQKYGQIQFLKDQGFTDEEIQKKFGLDPNMERGIIGQYGGLLNQRDEMKSDMISGIANGKDYAGAKLGTAVKWLGGSL